MVYKVAISLALLDEDYPSGRLRDFLQRLKQALKPKKMTKVGLRNMV